MSIFMFIILSILAIYIWTKVSKSYKLHNRVSQLKGFIPNPSYLISHARIVIPVSYKLKLRGMEVVKIISVALAKSAPYKDTGYAIAWVGNILYGFPIMLPFRTELVKEIFSSKKYVDKSLLYSLTTDFLGKGLITSEKETWARRRKLLNPQFHQHMLQSYVPAMNHQCEKLVQRIKLDLKKNGSNIILDTNSRISHRVMAMLLETIIGAKEFDIDPKFTTMAEKADEFMVNKFVLPWKLIPWYYNWTREGMEAKYHFDFIRNEAKKLVGSRISQLNMAGSDCSQEKQREKPALIDALINDHLHNPEITSLNDVTDEVLTFLLTGWDTTTWTASFTLLMLGLYPEVQEKVYQEIIETVSDVKNITMAETMKLKYLECVINESMRLLPLVNFYARRIETDVEVMIDGEKVVIPGGTDIWIESEMLHRNPRYWNDPDRFIPERFLPENSKNRDPYAFMPFSAGPRNCIGKAFGMMEDKVIITYLLSSFKIRSLDPLDKIRMNYIGIARRTHDPLKFAFELREK